ncbi:MAG: pyridoxal phosphate-dependent aminotransferase [Bacteroidales bacterium]|nr:pyridoxal phosphate-dependent aminotransferase [Bacteroidales bacterium]
MLTISKKGQEITASPIRKLIPLSDAAKKRGIQVYHLNIGQPDIETTSYALDAVKKYSEKVIKYSNSAGELSYRKKICKYYESLGINVTPEEIIVTTGGSEAIQMVFQTIMDPDDEVITPEPFYANYRSFAKITGVKIKSIPSDIKDGFALPPMSEFEKAITPKTKALLICNPNNPTGYLYSKEEMIQLGEIVKKHDIYLITDEVYREFCYDGAKHVSAMTLKGVENNVILIDSESKRYSACGIRVGRVVSKNKEVMSTVMKFAQARLSPPSYGQVAAEGALDTPASYFEGTVKEYTSRRNICVEGINKIPGAFCPTPKGAFYIVAHLPIDDSETFCKWLLTDFNYEGKTVMLAPACGFYSTPGRGVQEVRISYCLNCDALKEAMFLLEKALESYPGRVNE